MTKRLAFLGGAIGTAAALAVGCRAAVGTAPKKRTVGHLVKRPLVCVVPSEWDVTGNVASGNAWQAAEQATALIPIVVAEVGDVVDWIVPSRTRPGPNVTGFSAEIGPNIIKRLELLREAFPFVHRPLVVYGPSATHECGLAEGVRGTVK